MCGQEWDTRGRRGWDVRCEACVLAAGESYHRDRWSKEIVEIYKEEIG